MKKARFGGPFSWGVGKNSVLQWLRGKGNTLLMSVIPVSKSPRR
jgi:hypothetical protein